MTSLVTGWLGTAKVISATSGPPPHLGVARREQQELNRLNWLGISARRPLCVRLCKNRGEP